MRTAVCVISILLLAATANGGTLGQYTLNAAPSSSARVLVYDPNATPKSAEVLLPVLRGNPGTAAVKDVPASGDATAGQVVLGNDSRLTDARTPIAHNQAISTITGLQTALDGKETAGAAAAVTTTSIGAQPVNSELTAYSGVAHSANILSLLGAANYAAMRTLLGLVIGTNVQAYDADLTTYAGIPPSANVQALLAAASYAAMKALLSLDNVTNTSDANKPVSTAQQTALDLKANIAAPTFTTSATAPKFIGNGADGTHYGEFSNTADATTTGWGTAEAGRIWFNKTTQTWRQWTCPSGTCAISDMP